MNIISKKELATRANRTPQYIDKLQDKNPPVVNFLNLGQTASGKPKIKVDADGPLTRKFIIDCLGKGDSAQKTAVKREAVKKIKPKIPKYKAPKIPAPPTVNEYVPPLTTEPTPDGDDKHELEKRKLQEQIKDLELKNEIKRKDLIDKKLTVMVFNKIYGIHESQFKSLGVSATPKISAIYNDANTEKTNEILELFDKTNDDEFKLEINKILSSGEEIIKTKSNEVFEDATMSILKNIQREIEKFLKTVEHDAV